MQLGLFKKEYLLSKQTKKDLTKIKETQKEEEQPTGGLMSRPTQEEDE